MARSWGARIGVRMPLHATTGWSPFMADPTPAPDFSEEFEEETELKVFVPKSLKALLIDANQFEDAVVRAAGSRTGVSLNKTYVRYLSWAVASGWAAQGGVPKSAKDRDDKIQRAAAVLKELKQKGPSKNQK